MALKVAYFMNLPYRQVREVAGSFLKSSVLIPFYPLHYLVYTLDLLFLLQRLGWETRNTLQYKSSSKVILELSLWSTKKTFSPYFL